MDIYQISVFLENRAGQLSELTALLAQNEINLRAISIAETSDYGVLRMIVDNAERASSILLAHGNILTMTPVLVVAVPDRPAGLAELLSHTSNAQIDIEYMYSILSSCNEKAYMVFRTADDARLAAAIKGAGLLPATKEELGIR